MTMTSIANVSGDAGGGRMPPPVQAAQIRRHAARKFVRRIAGTAMVMTVAIATDGHAPAVAKTPGETYCFHGVCHRVLTVEETTRAVGRSETVMASFYDDPRRDAGNPNVMTSSGARYDPASDQTVASPIYPNGTRLLLWNDKTKAAALVRVTNSGPYHSTRRVDVSPVAAHRLGFKPLGVSPLVVTVIAAPSPEEAKYAKGRTYAAVPGYLGVFESHERARVAAGQPASPKTEQPLASKTVTTASIPQPAVALPALPGPVAAAAARRPHHRPVNVPAPVLVAAPVPVPVQPVARAPRPTPVPSLPVSERKPARPPASARGASPTDWATTLTDTSSQSSSPRPQPKSLGLRQ